MKGWIKIHRKVQEHWLWADDKYFRYWITILLNVNHEEKKFPVGDEIFICEPGQSFKSIAEWTRLFGCSKKTTIKFFKMLKNDGSINTKILGNGNRRKHLLIVLKWKDYQLLETENSTRREPETPPEGNPNVTPNKNEKNEKNNILMSQVDKSTLDPTSQIYFSIAFSFWEMVKQNLTELRISSPEIEKAKYQTWADPIRLLIEKDGKTKDEIREVYIFVRDDDFWCGQIRSTAKLRKKNPNGQKYFDDLLYKSRDERSKKVKSNNAKSEETVKTVESILERIEETQQ